MARILFAVYLLLALLAVTCGGAPRDDDPARVTGTTVATQVPDAAVECRNVPADQSRPRCFYEGALFDTHLHLGTVVGGALQAEYGSVEGLLALLRRDGIDCAVGFYGLPPPSESVDGLIARVREVAIGARSKVVPLLQPNHTEDFPAGQYLPIEAWLVPAGAFVGIGELALYFPAFRTLTLQHPVIEDVLNAVSKARGIVMIHPRNTLNPPVSSPEEMRAAVEAFPNVTFLFHGGTETIDFVLPLMDQFPNVYFTWDFATWPKPGVSFGNPTSPDQGSSSDFLDQIAQSGVDRIIRFIVKELELRLALHPDRIMWGTDRFLVWHFYEPASASVVEISRLVLARLPADLRTKYAYENAQRVFGRFLSAEC